MEYQDFLAGYNVFNRIYYLQSEIEKGNWNLPMAREYKEIRIIRQRGIEYANRRCQKLKMGEVS